MSLLMYNIINKLGVLKKNNKQLFARKELNFHMVEEGGNMGHFMQIIARNLPSISHLTIALSRLW